MITIFDMMRIGLLFSLLLLACVVEAQTLRVSGSDLLGEALQEALEEWATRPNTPDLELEFEGSILAREALANGEVDVALLALPVGQPLPQDWTQIPLTFEIAQVVVPQTNPLSALSLPDLQRIFAETSLAATHWDELGLNGEWSGKNIQRHAVRSNADLAWPLFQNRALEGHSGISTIQFATTVAPVLNRLLEDPLAIAILPAWRLPGSVKALSVSVTPQAPAYLPNAENVYFGDYPLRLPYVIVLSGNPDAATQELIRFLLSDRVAQALTERGYVALPATERESLMP